MRKNRYSWTSRRQWSSGGRPDRADPPFPVVRLPGSADGTYRVRSEQGALVPAGEPRA